MKEDHSQFRANAGRFSGPILRTSPLDAVPYIEAKDEILKALREMANGAHPGVLATVDEWGYPRTRWMASLICDDFPFLYALTFPASRKVNHINCHSRISWMFANEEMSLVLNLIGWADIVRDDDLNRDIWDRIRNKQHPYFLAAYSEGENSVVIRTRIERAEYSTPDTYRYFDVSPDELRSPSAS